MNNQITLLKVNLFKNVDSSNFNMIRHSGCRVIYFSPLFILNMRYWGVTMATAGTVAEGVLVVVVGYAALGRGAFRQSSAGHRARTIKIFRVNQKKFQDGEGKNPASPDPLRVFII